MPEFYLIAGPNGAGKSTFSSNLLPLHVQAFDADKELAIRESKYPNIEPWRLMEAIETHFFEDEKIKAIKAGRDFAFETNFSGSDAMRSVQQFAKAGYRVNLIFLGLDSPQLAIARVDLRQRSGGIGAQRTILWHRGRGHRRTRQLVQHDPA